MNLQIRRAVGPVKSETAENKHFIVVVASGISIRLLVRIIWYHQSITSGDETISEKLKKSEDNSLFEQSQRVVQINQVNLLS